jgi:hypothetical protein
MARRGFAVQLLLAIALMAALNVVIARLAVNAVPRQLLRAIQSSPPVTTVLAGNSLVEAGIDAAAYAQASGDGPAINIGMGSSSPIEHDLLLHRAMALRPRRVVYGFFDAQLTAPPGVAWSDLFGNRAAAFYIDPDVAERLIAPDSRWQRFQFRALGHLPMFVERAAIWAGVERWRRRLREIGVPPEPVGRFGRIADFAELEALTPEAFRLACAQAVASRTPLTGAIADLLDETRQRHAATFVVEMPQTSRHRARYYETPEWAAYREYVAGEIRRAGANYLKASDWMPDEAFEDGMHLSPAGARDFAVRLAAPPPPAARE